MLSTHRYRICSVWLAVINVILVLIRVVLLLLGDVTLRLVCAFWSDVDRRVGFSTRYYISICAINALLRSDLTSLRRSVVEHLFILLFISLRGNVVI